MSLVRRILAQGYQGCLPILKNVCVYLEVDKRCLLIYVYATRIRRDTFKDKEKGERIGTEKGESDDLSQAAV